MQAGVLDRFFRITEQGSTLRREIMGGLTTFMAMCYLIFVVPGMLADAGMPKEAAVAATIWTTVVATLGMGLWANFPVAVAPGLGISAFFAYYVCGVLHMPWQAGLGAVFISGVVFLVLTVTRIRQLIIESVPMDLKYAIVVGIGTFIAFIGMKNCGIIVADPSTFVTLGDVSRPGVLLALAGIFLTGMLLARGVTGAMIIGILAITALGFLTGVETLPASLEMPSASAFTPAGTFLELDIPGALSYGFVFVIFTLTMVDLFDNIGVLIGVSRKAGLMRADGHIPGLDRALITDSVSTMFSACMGTTTATSYLESAAGIAEGGRTGLVAVVVALLFLASLALTPLIKLVPVFATAPVLILVGVLMMQEVAHINFKDFTVALPAFLTIVTMPLTFSIATGFGFGFISYVGIKLLAGRWRELSPIMWIIALCFAINFVMRTHG